MTETSVLKILICLILGGFVVPQEKIQSDDAKVQKDAVEAPKPLLSAMVVDDARKAAEKRRGIVQACLEQPLER